MGPTTAKPKFKKSDLYIGVIVGGGIIFILNATMPWIIGTSRGFRSPKPCKTPGELLYTDPASGNTSCYPRYTPGKCPEDNMVLFPVNGSIGVCYCDNFRSQRYLVYHEGRCYPVFTQGFCSPEEWITISKSNKSGSCTPNYCLNQIMLNNNDNNTLVPLRDGSCAILGIRLDSCHPNGSSGVIRFFRGKLYPSCRNYKNQAPNNNNKNTIMMMRTGGISVPHSDCPPGFFRTELGFCAIEFDDS